jgi:Type IV secretory system Conjugative DNA transfer
MNIPIEASKAGALHACKDCLNCRIPQPAGSSFVDTGRMSSIEREHRENILEMLRDEERKESLEARHYRALSSEPRFFYWCHLKTFGSSANNQNEKVDTYQYAASLYGEAKVADSTPICWYRLCQIENDQGYCSDFQQNHAHMLDASLETETTPQSTVHQAQGNKAQIVFGRRMRLKEVGQTPDDMPDNQIVPEITFRSPSERNALITKSLDPALIRQELQATNEMIALNGEEALKLSYGIFGSPGSGKTRLFLGMSRKALEYQRNNHDLRFGALILDPKAALIEQVKEIMTQTGRDPENLTVLNLIEASKNPVNILKCSFDPFELGRLLVIIARSAGLSVSDPYWMNVMGDLLGAALFLWRRHLRSNRDPSPTLKQVLDSILNDDENGRTDLQHLATIAKFSLQSPDCQDRNALKTAISRVNRFYQDSRQVNAVSSTLSRAYGAFQLDRYECFSGTSDEDSIYDQIIRDGKVVMVSMSPADADAAKTLCTLVKCLFQQTVLGRHERMPLHKRPVLLACDEFSVIATELKGESIGDGHFFALARENRCMGLLATQSVHTLKNSSLGDAWESIYSNFAAKIFMRCGDVETAEAACELAGKSEWRIASESFRTSSQDSGVTETLNRIERNHLFARQLTTLKCRQGVVIGTLDGGQTAAEVQFFEAALEGAA